MTPPDYQRLIDEPTWAFIRQTAEFYPPDAVGLSIADQRAIYDRMCRAFHQGYPPGVTAQDARLGGVPVRIYEGRGTAATVVYFHGGGFVVGGLESHDDVCAEICDATGFRVVSVDYRLAPEHPFPAAPDDAFAAVEWAAAHAAEIGGRADRLAVAGDSAGGNLVAAAALRARDRGGPALRALVNIYGSCNYPSEQTASAREYADGPILKQDDIDWFYEQYLRDPAREQHDPQAAPVRAASHAGLPPTFVGTAECDPSRDDAELFGAKVAAAGVEVEIRRYPGMVHGFASWVGFLPGARAVLQDAAAFLKRHLES